MSNSNTVDLFWTIITALKHRLDIKLIDTMSNLEAINNRGSTQMSPDP